PHARSAVPEEVADREGFDLQMSRLSVLEPVLTDYLEEAPRELRAALPRAHGQDLKDTLQALLDLHAEAGPAVIELLEQPGGCAEAELAVELLTWSRDARVGLWLRSWMGRQVSPVRRAQWRRRPSAPRRPSVPAEIPYRAALRALRGHASADTERFLLQA